MMIMIMMITGNIDIVGIVVEGVIDAGNLRKDLNKS
jgi:hypothetical protein